jgi:hypothetical protein
MNLPRFAKIKQELPRPVVSDIPSKIINELGKINLGLRIKPGQRIAITAGSRGIRNIVVILRTLVEAVKAAGADPFIVGAMGSHGGGSAEGQEKILASLGITEKNVGCPVLTTAEVVEIGRTSRGVKVFCDINAWQADGIIVCNRIKPHTTFHGPVESGLVKMMAVGLGKKEGASFIHRVGPDKIASALLEIGEIFLHSKKVVAGVGIVENGYDETALIQATLPEDLIQTEMCLLKEAYRLMPRLPVEKLDFLVVKEMGKNISGTGMDVNVIGRMRIAGVPEPAKPLVARIVVLDLTEESHGNATGIGLADITTEHLVKKINREVTYLNCLTSGNVQRAMLPIIMPDDQKAIEAAIKSLAAGDPTGLRGAIIKNTLELEYLWVTENLAEELIQGGQVELVDPVRPLDFQDGFLVLDL